MASRPLHPPVSELVSDKPWLRLIPRAAAALSWQLETPSLDVSDDIPLTARCWRGEFFGASEAETRALVARCRHHRVTVGQALGAAMRIQFARMARERRGRDRVRVAFTLMVDMRPWLSPALSLDDLGEIISPVVLTADVGPGDDVWALARACGAQLKREFDLGVHRAWTLVPGLIGRRIQHLIRTRNNGRSAQAALLLSSVGRHPPIESGGLRVTRLFSTAAQVQWGSTFAVSANSLGEALSIHLGYPSPAISEKTARSFLSGILELLGVDGAGLPRAHATC